MNRCIVRLVCLCLLGAAVLSVAGCNTVSGAGKDVEAGGRAVHNAAEDAK
jgi:entericidin B